MNIPFFKLQKGGYIILVCAINEKFENNIHVKRKDVIG
jgi:hypothetical protein